MLAAASMLRQSDSDPASGPLQIVELAPQSAPQTLARHKKRGKEEEAKMVEVNAKGKPKGFSVDSCIGYTIYFAILVAVAVIGKPSVNLVILSRTIQGTADSDTLAIPRCMCVLRHCCRLVFDKKCSMKRYETPQLYQSHQESSFVSSHSSFALTFDK